MEIGLSGLVIVNSYNDPLQCLRNIICTSYHSVIVMMAQYKVGEISAVAQHGSGTDSCLCFKICCERAAEQQKNGPKIPVIIILAILMIA